MIVYKLTDKDGYCRRGLFRETLYEVGKTYISDGDGDLCTFHWRHAYENPLLAVFHDPIHGKYGKNARLWECDTLDGVIKRNGMMKLGTSKLKVLKEIEKPQVTLEQRIAYAIYCSLRVYAEESYVKWAENWLSNKDRSKESAWAAIQVTAEETYALASAALHAAYARRRLRLLSDKTYAAARAAAECAARAVRMATNTAVMSYEMLIAEHTASSASHSEAYAIYVQKIELDLLDCALMAFFDY